MVEVSPLVKYELENEFNDSFQQNMQSMFQEAQQGKQSKPWQ